MAPLTHEEKVAAFKAATRSLIHWYGDEIIAGVTDERLEELLKKLARNFRRLRRSRPPQHLSSRLRPENLGQLGKP